jgi:hypothetical protein
MKDQDDETRTDKTLLNLPSFTLIEIKIVAWHELDFGQKFNGLEIV